MGEREGREGVRKEGKREGKKREGRYKGRREERREGSKAVHALVHLIQIIPSPNTHRKNEISYF